MAIIKLHPLRAVFSSFVLLAPISFGLVGCATEVDLADDCSQDDSCEPGPEEEPVAESDAPLTTRPSAGGSASCVILQCNGLANPFGTLVCVWGRCVCITDDKGAICEPGETVCKQRCSSTASTPGGMAP